ncbi:MAG: Ig-like domain-containing protein, partial [Christensenellales bacterium]
GMSIGVGGEIDFVDGVIKLDIEVESMSVSVVFEMLMGEPINLNLPLDEIPDWDASSGATFVKTMLDGLDIAFALDYAMSTADIMANYNANGSDSGVEDGNKYYTRLIIQKLQSNTTLYNTGGKTASAGSILVTLASINKSKYENTDQLNSNTNQQPLLYAELNYNTGNLRIVLCQGVLTLGSILDFASFIDINIALDLVNLLAPTIDSLFASIDPDYNGGSTGGGTEGGGSESGGGTEGGGETTPTEPTRLDKAFANLNVVQLLGGGIDVYLRNTGLFNANITFDPYTINWLLDEVMASVFGWDTIIDLVEMTRDATTGSSMFSTNYLKSVNWDRIDAEHTWVSLKQILLPLLKDVVNGVGYGWAAPLLINAILNAFYFQVRRLFTRLLPLPVFNEVTAGINIMDGTIANLYIFGYDYDEPVYKAYDENGNKIAKEDQSEIYVFKAYSDAAPGSDVPAKGTYTRKYDRSTDANDDQGASYTYYYNNRSNGYYLEIKLFNCSPSVGDPEDSIDGSTEGVMTWGSIDAAPTYDPYCYSNNSEGKSLFLAQNFSGKEVSYQKGEQLYKTTPTYEVTKKNGQSVSMNINDLDFGTAGVYEIVATASFNGGAVVRTMPINLTIYGADTITDVGEYNLNKEYQNYIDIYAYSEIPKYIVITYDTPDVLGNYMRRIPTESMTFTSYAPTAYTKHGVDGTVTFKNGTSKSVRFEYLDSTIKDIMGGIEVDIDLYQYDQTAVDLSVYTPDLLYFTYNDGSSDKITVNGAWNVSSAQQLVDRDPSNLSAGIYWITNTIGSGATLQEVNIKFVVKSKTVDSIEANGNLNNIRISPYQYYKYLITGDENDNPFPSQVLATYNEAYAYDAVEDANVLVNEAYSEMVYVNWNKDGLNFTWDNNNAPEYNPDGSLKKNGSVSLDTTSVKDPTAETPVRIYETSFDWTFPVNITMDRNEVQAIYFDEELTQNTLIIDPYLFKINEEDGIDNFPTSAWVKFTNGTVINLPIAWIQEEVDNFEVAYEAQSRQFRVYIGYDVDTYTNNRIPRADATSALGIADYCTAKGISGKMLQRIVVNARVEGLEAGGLDIAGSELKGGRYVIDPVKVKYLGESALPATVPVVYNDGSSSVLPVVWDYKFDISIYGSENLVATATIRGTDISFDVTCRILDRSTPEVVNDSISLNPYNFTLGEGDKRVYSEFTETIAVKYFTSYTLVVTNNETGEETIFEGLFDDEKNALVNQYTTGANTGLYTVATKYNYDTFDLPVSWDISDVDMAVTSDKNADKNFGVKAKITGATESFETLTVNVTIEEKIFVGINSNAVYKYFISYGGSNLTEQEIATKMVTKQLNAFFEDGTMQKLDIVFDLSPVNFTVANYDTDNAKFIGDAIKCDAYIMQYAEIQQKIQIEVYVATEPTASEAA